MKVNNEITRAVGLEVLSVDEETRTVEFVISSEAKDSFGTVFLSDKWRMARYEANPVFTFNHHDWSNDPDDTLGTSTIRFEDGKMIASATFEDNEPDGDRNEKADKLFRKAKKGTIRGASIRAAVYEADWGNKERNISDDTLVFSDQELIAWSVVTVPSNPEALSRATKAVEAIRSAIPKPGKGAEALKAQNNEEETIGEQRTTAESDKKRTLSRFEAQTIINENQM